ncbi:hypothetical protein [Pseudomonas oryzihabitans]|uniref:hypothetical protein n=1 Tax=Pseudomonas oryzihabitans TaxID=47885 RepID=UPI0028947BC5|nr:hypothetical protein [Pseudomonas oryzihabitans]MDT3718480.1 hypothetical protein [Pseudomonas oryzihabitans]
MSKLVYGVGINDLASEEGKTDFYRKWVRMLERCYSAKYLEKYSSYKGCSVCAEWLTFSNFKTWMKDQDYEGKHLDKDILIPGNRIYSPETCAFISCQLNLFLIEGGARRGEYPIGVDFRRKINKFRAQCNASGNRKTLGYFDTAEEAHAAWLEYKLSQARILAAQQPDPRIAAALIARYENYKDSAARAA